MKKVLTKITAIILGILSTIILGGIGALVLVTTAGIVALLIAIIFLLAGILLGYAIFKSVRKRDTSDFSDRTHNREKVI